MQRILPFKTLAFGMLATSLFLGSSNVTSAGADTYRGLWVGQATLQYVNEVTVPLDANNQPVAPDPAVPTPTADASQIRLILHVNGAGQVSLLKDVAVLHRNGNPADVLGSGGQVIKLADDGTIAGQTNLAANTESDLALVTDERLYPDFPPQVAVRIASAVFDFGDAHATEALDAVVDAAVTAAVSSVLASSDDLGTDAGRLSARNTASQAARNAAQPVVDNADVATAFSEFLIEHFKSSDVDAIAEAADPSAQAQPALIEATNVMNRSFYKDRRAVDLVLGVVAAVQAAATPEAKRKAAHNAAAAVADVTDNYQRFLAGKQFGDMIRAAATAAATAALAPGATSQTIREAVGADATVNEARAEAIRLKAAPYDDSRAPDAVEIVIEAVVQEAATFIPGSTAAESEIAAAAERAGRLALETSVPRYAVPVDRPTLDYNGFVASDAFRQSAQVAADAAAQAAVDEKANNALFTPESIRNAARIAAFEALREAYGAAARTVQTELPLAGRLEPGQGDARLRWEIHENQDAPLGAAGLTGTIALPANHPTNPFRHRRHPDHAVGFDVTRHIRFDFDPSPTNGTARAGYGVDRLSGVYREEVFGLHKPLGPNPETAPIGLRVEGRFELNRVTLIDTLNAR